MYELWLEENFMQGEEVERFESLDLAFQRGAAILADAETDIGGDLRIVIRSVDYCASCGDEIGRNDAGGVCNRCRQKARAAVFA